ncbi:MAG: metalloregulator ArsR/SmtB family transcription factor [Faecousia sp.]
MDLQLLLRALADPIRREILTLLKDGRKSAGEISDCFPVSGAAVSRHLSVLKEAGLVTDRREGKFIYYRWNPQALEPVTRWLAELERE